MILIPPQPVGSLPGSGYWNDWIEKIRYLINRLQQGFINHNDLQNIQGGSLTERYHLTATQLTTATTPSIVAAIATVSSSTVLTTANGTVLVDTTGGNITITLPNATTTSTRMFVVKRITGGLNTLTLDTGGGNIDGSASINMPTQYESLTVQSNGTHYWII